MRRHLAHAFEREFSSRCTSGLGGLDRLALVTLLADSAADVELVCALAREPIAGNDVAAVSKPAHQCGLCAV
jgi:hypothetical protein